MYDLETSLKSIVTAEPKEVPSGRGLRRAAVLAPFFYDGEDWRLLFTKRSDLVENHKGQVSFPGGAVEPADRSLIETAVRETEEEIGLDRDRIDVLGYLPPIVTITRFLVYPVVGLFDHPDRFELSEQEVDSVLEIPVPQLIAEAEDQAHLPAVLYSHRFNRDGEIIWGATARIVYELLSQAFLNHPPAQIAAG